ncbi:MAG: TIGR04283 family arsenosugar biosynthesis glycosyltransferase [Rhodobacteraceae bacterium]|nr:TIGR04283 family arsenosugar biosynthesis glycosyltransferase [Paracoccaceae bacterium]
MAAEISVIIPTLNAERVLPACLESLIEGLGAGLIRELIVTDGGSTDATLPIAESAGATIVAGPASRGGQLRHGVKAAKGNWLLVLHADTVLGAGWAQQVQAHLENADGTAAWFRLAYSGGGMAARWVAGWANLRSSLFGLPYGDQGLLVSRQMYQQVGGYPDQPLMEDVAIVRALGGQLTGLSVTATTGAERYQRAGWFRCGARNLWTLARYFAGVDPKKLAASYRRT